MSLIEDVIRDNTLKVPHTQITQEFVVRVSIQTPSTDPKFIRNLLDGVAATLDTINYKADDSKIEVTQVYAK